MKVERLEEPRKGFKSFSIILTVEEPRDLVELWFRMNPVLGQVADLSGYYPRLRKLLPTNYCDNAWKHELWGFCDKALKEELGPEITREGEGD